MAPKAKKTEWHPTLSGTQGESGKRDKINLHVPSGMAEALGLEVGGQVHLYLEGEWAVIVSEENLDKYRAQRKRKMKVDEG